jgi:hypothetical protein
LFLVSLVGHIRAVPASHPDRDRDVRLTNRSASLSLLAALFFFVGLVTFGVTVQKTEDFAVRAVSGAPLVAAVGSAMWAGVTRSQLRALRDDGVARHGAAGELAVPDSDGPLPPNERPCADSTPRSET